MEISYRTYRSDADKAKAYSRRLFQADRDFDTWKSKAEEAFARYENTPKATSQNRTADGDVIVVPEGVSIIDSLFSSLTAVEADISLTPKGDTTDDQAYVATAALSQEWGKTKAAERMNDAVKDSLLIGIGWGKVSYEFYEAETEVPRADEDIELDIATAIQAAEDRGEVLSQSQLEAIVPVTRTEKKTLKNRIVVDYVPWDQVRWDPTAKKARDIQWVCQKTLMHPEEVKQNPVWREYVGRTRGALRKLDDVKGDTMALDKDLLGPAEPEDMRCTVYEMHDFQTGNVCTFLRNTDFLLNEVPGFFSQEDDLEDKSPFVPLILRQTSRRVRGISEMEVLLPSLKHADKVDSRLQTYLSRFAPKFIATEGLFTESGKNAVRSQEYGAVAEIVQGRDPREVLPVAPPQLPSEVFAIPARLRQQMYEATGMNELNRGLFPDRLRTATETAEVVSASAARQAEQRSQLERFYKAIAKRILKLMQMFYEEEQIAQLVDDAGPVPWAWSAEDIVGDYDFEVSLTPKQDETWQSRRDDALAQQQLAAGMASAQGGQPRPDMVPGPLSAGAAAAATNQGELPPEVLLAA